MSWTYETLREWLSGFPADGKRYQESNRKFDAWSRNETTCIYLGGAGFFVTLYTDGHWVAGADGEGG